MKGRVVTIKFVRTRGQHNSYQSFVSFPPRKNKKTEKKKAAWIPEVRPYKEWKLS